MLSTARATHRPTTAPSVGSTSSSIYERHVTLERKRRRGRATDQWISRYPALFLDRLLSTSNPLDFFALMGLIAGALVPLDEPGREKDFRRYAELPGFVDASRFLTAVGAPAVNRAPGTDRHRKGPNPAHPSDRAQDADRAPGVQTLSS
jgi:hypothetical protein